MSGPMPRGDGATLNQFNAQLRANPEYRAFLRSIGANPDGPLKLTGQQRSAAEAWIRQRFPQIGNKLQVDPAGNLNTDHGLSTAWSNPYFRYPLIAGGTLATMGALGAFSGAAGAAGGAGGGSGAAAGLLPSSQLAMSPLYTGPVVGGSQAVSSMLPSAANALWQSQLYGGPGTAGGGSSVLDKIWGGIKTVGGGVKKGAEFLDKHKEAASLAAVLPLLLNALKGDGDRPESSGLPGETENPFGDLDSLATDARDAYGMQKRRVEQAQPAFDALVYQAYGMTPTRYRGAQPDGYPAKAQEPASGGYAYRGPQFG